MGTHAQPLSERVVLVVDDEPVVCRLTARILTEAGFRVLEAHSGVEAAAQLAGLGAAVIGLMVSDITMPGMTGVHLADIVAERWPSVPVLLVSGQGGPATGYIGPFLAKPFQPEALIRAVSALLPLVENPHESHRRRATPA